MVDQRKSLPSIHVISELNLFTLMPNGVCNYECDSLKDEYIRVRIPEFPCLLYTDGSPWPEGNAYLLESVCQRINFSLHTLKSIANDLLRYLRFFTSENIDFKYLPSRRPAYPVHRFQYELKMQVEAGCVSSGTAERCLGRIEAFYDWMAQESFVSQELASKVGKRARNCRRNFNVRSGKTEAEKSALSALSKEEQVVLVKYLKNINNIELRLIYYVALITGMRLQSILTLQKHIFDGFDLKVNDVYSITIGDSTGIDSKYGKNMVIHVPTILMQKLEIYYRGKRAISRRKKDSKGKYTNYIFLNSRGKPYYITKKDRLEKGNDCFNDGGYVGKFTRNTVLPQTGLEFKFHHIRATFAMNLVDAQLALVSKGIINLNQARNYVRERLGHESSEVTDQYLNIRSLMSRTESLQRNYESKLLELL